MTADDVAQAISSCEAVPPPVDLDVLAVVQSHVDAEFEDVLAAEGGDPVAAAIAFMLRGVYVGEEASS